MTKGPYQRTDKLIKEKRHDVYQERAKLPEPTRCSLCNALYVHGRWSWSIPPQNAYETVCPACRRITEKFPAGYIELKGKFFREHYEEIIQCIQNIEKQEKSKRPLERILAITEVNHHTLVTTTGIHIAQRIGAALARSFKGDLSLQYADSEKNIRVYWER